MKNRNKNTGLNSNNKSKHAIMHNNREICLKNYLIDLLKNERTFINDKELAIQKALQESENGLEKDYRDFVEFMDEEKKTSKTNEQVNYILN